MHALIFWGVTIQVIGTAINLMQMALFIPFVELPFPRGAAYLFYELVMDLAGIAILIGVGMAVYRRIAQKPKSLPTRWDDYYALILLAAIPTVGYFLEASRLVSVNPQWAGWSPIGNLLANALRNLGLTPETAFQLHSYLFWFHAALGLALLASIPFTKLRHLVTTPLNVIFRTQREYSALEVIDDIEEAEILGVGKVEEFNSQQLLSFDACLQCGRCEEACPAALSGLPYSPRGLLQSLRDVMDKSLVQTNGNPDPQLLGGEFPEEYPWSCTTCGACLYVCPAFINPLDEIIDLRRYQSLTTGKLPKSVADTLRNFERQGNPWGMPPEQRTSWADGLGVRVLSPGDETDVLLYLGCAFAFDERNKSIARSFVQVLKEANVDFAILGLEESCCGETARRMGHEYLFQVFAEQNMEVFSSVKFNRIVTQCPHCFNTLKNEYPQFGGDLPVQHYSEFLTELVGGESPLLIGGVEDDQTYTYHDSCYLGRFNQIYNQPRSLLEYAKIDTVEMPRNGQDSFCCGGGGGQMWMETDADTRINHHRLNDALETKADIIATACPYCLLMFDDAIRSKGIGDHVKVKDIAEILVSKLDRKQDQTLQAKV
jgi:Fe-S oxidoreductase/nitrate reductase gamma subunit